MRTTILALILTVIALTPTGCAATFHAFAHHHGSVPAVDPGPSPAPAQTPLPAALP
jgi:hypothetical protein